jgi:dTDP-4-dehydrorhamnose reductase
MNILVTGANGQLGSEIKLISKKYTEFNFIFTDIHELDLTSSSKIEAFFSENSIDLIINCAAYTSVDLAETEKELAELINVEAIRFLANIATTKKIKVIHISTDYVFDGTHYRPYKEDEMTSPNSVYGRTKLQGEQALKNSGADYIIIRTSWLYSAFGNNFVKTILRLSSERNDLNVVADQIGTPTYAADLAEVLLKIASNYNKTGVFKKDIYHYSNQGVCSWYDFATEIVELSNNNCKINAIETHRYPTPAKRPFFSVLCKDKIKKTFDIEIPHWKSSLKKCILLLKTN